MELGDPEHKPVPRLRRIEFDGSACRLDRSCTFAHLRFALNGAGGAPNPLGDFRIVREVGHGGMGIVYEADQLSLGRRVALKVMVFAATMDPRQLQRFQNEARAAASLEHPHIVPVYGVGCERGLHYYAMKFIEGQSLAAIIDAQRTGSAGSPFKEAAGDQTPRTVANTTTPIARA